MYVDTLIIGAGISGLIIANNLIQSRSIVIIEQQEDVGGTWMSRKCYANLKTHAPRYSFHHLDWGEEDVTKKAPCESVFEALRRKSISIKHLIRFSTKVVKLEQHGQLVLVRTSDNETIECSCVVYTGSTYRPHVPENDHTSFRGKILVSEQLTAEKLKYIQDNDLSVVVVGGSKAACDHVYNLSSLKNLTWVARKTYWFVNFKNYTSWYFKCMTILGLYVLLKHDEGEDVATSTVFKWLKDNEYYMNPHGDLFPSFNFHGGIVEENQISTISNVHFECAEVIRAQHNTVTLSNGKNIRADVLVYCTGYSHHKLPVHVHTPDKQLIIKPENLSHENMIRGLVNPICDGIIFINTLSLGDITTDVQLISEWIQYAYPTKHSLNKALKSQNIILRHTKLRSFNIWNAFDRPIPYSILMKRLIKNDINSEYVNSSIIRPNIYMIDGIAIAIPHHHYIIVILMLLLVLHLHLARQTFRCS